MLKCSSCCSKDLPCGKDLIVLKKESHVQRLDIMLRVLSIIQQLLQENKHGTKRDIYYMQPSIFLGKGRSSSQRYLHTF
ncbi:hypothetical protein ZOSMA_454G00050 [Zostera marina]|uniref:Spo11/DNA topoisomerase VI subunit A N-terminal domain-containing protein n=1 Tax=Zostera marina TaxID=29655 RepID=A0A0K9P2Y0_ZOSMR|nr:hypothetical protein ZOSMA_454G00050 [Zostera marina]